MYGQYHAFSNQSTITGSPTVTVYDPSGIVVAGYSGIAVAGYDVVACPSPRVWVKLDTTTLPQVNGLVVLGNYIATFKFDVANVDDGLVRTVMPKCLVRVIDESTVV